MKIALLGYGKMGKEVEKIALKRGHEIVLKIKKDTDLDLSRADIAIDFSVPKAALKNITECFINNTPVVSGTMGWLEHFDKAVLMCNKNNGSLIHASNFSIGMTLFFELNKQLAKMMNPIDEYSTHIEETHHIEKVDTPSGTAISLAEGIISNSSKIAWKLAEKQTMLGEKIIPIHTNRIKNITGTHSIIYESEVDRIEIKHAAKSRKGFALGAVIAAEWLVDKIGIFTMKDVLNIG